MDLGLKGKVALVTGASSGIGAAVARAFAEEGSDVIVCYRHDVSGAEGTAQTVRNEGRTAWTCAFDLASPESIQRAVAGLQEQIQSLDVLVLCAGENRVTPVEEVTPEEWQQVIDTNLNGAFYLVQAAIPWLNDGAAIVTVSSVAAHTGAPHHAHYAAAKAGLINLTKSLARQLAPRVRVNCVAPGLTRTPMGLATIANLEEGYAQKKLLLQRFAEPEEIARVIVFVASTAASFMTGATVDVNGGRELR